MGSSEPHLSDLAKYHVDASVLSHFEAHFQHLEGRFEIRQAIFDVGIHVVIAKPPVSAPWIQRDGSA